MCARFVLKNLEYHYVICYRSIIIKVEEIFGPVVPWRGVKVNSCRRYGSCRQYFVRRSKKHPLAVHYRIRVRKILHAKAIGNSHPQSDFDTQIHGCKLKIFIQYYTVLSWIHTRARFSQRIFYTHIIIWIRISVAVFG